MDEATLIRAARQDHELVLEFHLRFSLPRADVPRLLDPDLQRFRIARLREELDEYEAAVANEDLPGAADALVDLAYIVHGTAIAHGVPWRALFDEVHAANMRKVQVADAEDSKHGHAADIKKPLGWRPPDVFEVLRAHGWHA